ncbi:unnamed protein product [Durusdinium trenchii]|uniref:Gfo/Idh/MocA-like oxidoreductase N-terminal domain-containing protein n=1 Tax=Durusdinium trenchii TaxID=1381693 RepID=A0ABP0KC55_9DINO
MPDPFSATRCAHIAVVGAGWWSQGWHLPHLSRNYHAQITAIVEPCEAPRSTLNPDLKTTEELQKLYAVPVFKTFDEFLASPEAEQTDGVIIATTHSAHYEVGMKAIGRFHVLMEKPMTTDLAEADWLAQAASKSDHIFMLNNTANFRDSTEKVHNMVKSKIGQVRSVNCYMAAALLWLFEDPENVGWIKPTGSMQGNGFGLGQMSHALAWLYFVTDLEPEKVCCSMLHSEKTGADITDIAIVHCAGNAIMSIHGTASMPFKSYFESTKHIHMKIFGSGGVLSYGGEDQHPESGGLRLELFDGTDQHLPGFYFENYQAEGDGPESLQVFLSGCTGTKILNAADAMIGRKATSMSFLCLTVTSVL